MSLAALKARYAGMSIAQLNNARDAVTKRLYYYNHTVPDRTKAQALSAEAKVILASIYKAQGLNDKYLSFLMVAGELLKPAEAAIDSAKNTASSVLGSLSTTVKYVGVGFLFIAVVIVAIKAKAS